MSDYAAFLRRKAQLGDNAGFEPVWMPDFLFDFQHALVEWAVRKGRAALFCDCGLGKGPMSLVWAENVVRKTNKPVLIGTPLAVSYQLLREGEKFGIECHRVIDGKVPPGVRIIVTNYERLHLFDSSQFAGMVCDESSILKSFDGTRKAEITEFMRTLPYRLLCTATAAPNDYIELGTSSEALGELGHMDMLARFFKNDHDNSQTQRMYGQQSQWRFKHHAEQPFWRWVCSWARAVRRPSDLGFDDARFVLPPLVETEHVIEVKSRPDEFLFDMPAVGLKEQRDERRRTIQERCEKVAELVADDTGCALIWCHLNPEGDLLEKLIPGAVQVCGADSDDYKEMAIEWFTGNKCLCNEPAFSAKFAAWRNIHLGTGRNTIKSTASSSLKGRNGTRTNTANGSVNTAANTTQLTNGCGERRRSNNAKSTKGGSIGTRPTLSSVAALLNSPQEQDNAIQTPDSSVSFPDTELRLIHTIALSSKDAPSVGGEQMLISDVSSGSTLTTATAPASSEGCSAPHAISASESLEMTLNVLSVPPCTCGHRSGRRTLISKAVMFGWGLNLQCCSHIVTFATHSFESYYQSVRRCWRFGQTQEVCVDIVVSPGEQRVLANLRRKATAADRMFGDLVKHMGDVMHLRRSNDYDSTEVVPTWL